MTAHESMTLPAILNPERDNPWWNRSVSEGEVPAALEHAERRLAALRRLCAVPLHACDGEPRDMADELLEDLWTLVEDIPPPLPGGDRLTLNGDDEAIDTAWLEWRKELWAAEGQADELRRRLTRGVVKLVPG
jgi:hypothetical protein